MSRGSGSRSGTRPRAWSAGRSTSSSASHRTGGGSSDSCLSRTPSKGSASWTCAGSGTTSCLMNPPFGDATAPSLNRLDSQLAASGRELGACFVAAANGRWATRGMVGTVLSSSPMFHPTFSGWRHSQLLGDHGEVRAVAHLGGDVLDGATVSASAIVIGKEASTVSSFFRLIRCTTKERALERVSSIAERVILQ